MKKYIALVLVMVLTLSLFAGCKPKSDNPASGKTVTPSGITISYINWNLGTAKENNIERQMIKEFEKKTGHKIKIVEGFAEGANYTEFLTGLAAGSRTPDVAMMTSIPLGLENQWISDISEITSTDPDWKKIPKTLEESTHYKGKTYAVPAGYFLGGYLANDDLFNNSNVNTLEYGYTYDQFVDAVKKLTNLNQKTIGLGYEQQFINWYAASKNQKLGWFTWDGEKYNLNAPEFKEGLEKAKEIRKGKYSYDSLSESERAAMGAALERDVWNQGKIGLYWTNTADLPKISKESKFEKRFVGIPGGRAVIIGDYMGISPTANHKKESYDFAKWMTFSPEGIKKRLELDKDGKQFNSLPLTTDKETIDAYFKKNTFPGIEDAFKQIDTAMIEGVKVVPGYGESRWSAKTGKKIGLTSNAKIDEVITAAWMGTVSFGDYADALNKLANEKYAEAVKKIETLY